MHDQHRVDIGCSEFLSCYSDFLDDTVAPELKPELEVHVRSCPSCGRYHQVFSRGAAILRGSDAVPVSLDFRPRLQHRLLDAVRARELSTGLRGSGATAAVLVGVALVLAGAAWAPVLRAVPVIELSPIVATVPAAQRPIRQTGIHSTLRPSVEPAPEDLWDYSRSRLFEYSTLQDRGRMATIVRSGLD